MSEKLSAVPTVEIDLFEEKHTLRYTFRAYQELGLNPFNQESIEEYSSQQFTPRELARQIWAGLLHQYYGRLATRKGEAPPTVDDVMDELDPITYAELWIKIQIAMGVDPEQKPPAGKTPTPKRRGRNSRSRRRSPEAPANPPTA